MILDLTSLKKGLLFIPSKNLSACSLRSITLLVIVVRRCTLYSHSIALLQVPTDLRLIGLGVRRVKWISIINRSKRRYSAYTAGRLSLWSCFFQLIKKHDPASILNAGACLLCLSFAVITFYMESYEYNYFPFNS